MKTLVIVDALLEHGYCSMKPAKQIVNRLLESEEDPKAFVRRHDLDFSVDDGLKKVLIKLKALKIALPTITQILLGKMGDENYWLTVHGYRNGAGITSLNDVLNVQTEAELRGVADKLQTMIHPPPEIVDELDGWGHWKGGK